MGTSNQLFQNLKSKEKISDKQLKYFTYEYKKVSKLGKLYLLSKIHKRLHNVPGRPVISNCGTPTEKVKNGNLMVKLKKSCEVQPLKPSLHQRMLVFL